MTKDVVPRAAGRLDASALSRRTMLEALAGAMLLTTGCSPLALAARLNPPQFPGLVDLPDVEDFATHHIAPGYEADVLIRWGDRITPAAPAFDPLAQTADAQRSQFGGNNDFVGFIPIGSDASRGLLCVHHEYPISHMMFPGLGVSSGKAARSTSPEQVAIEMAAVGGTIIEIMREAGHWRPVLESRFNRRITATDHMAFDGPAADHERLKTNADPSLSGDIGTLANCAGGMTPWGTWLMTEENFHYYFWTEQQDSKGRPHKGLGGAQAASWARYAVPQAYAGWARHVPRFNVDVEPNEPNRFGWIIEVDPLNPASVPVKHTALGRFRHEGAETALSRDGRAVVYSGDDDKNEFVYKFVSSERFDPNDRPKSLHLLSQGTLYVAKFEETGFRGRWIPLVAGEGELAGDPRFATQGDVVIDVRLAASKVGATPMDRPEDVEPGPGGRVIVVLTNNDAKDGAAGNPNAANPLPRNDHGHIIEITEDGGDNAATTFSWRFLIFCGPEGDARAPWHPDTPPEARFSCPDNVALDPLGRLWVGTDQGSGWHHLSRRPDGLFAVETIDGQLRSHLFFRAPIGAEVTGPRFTPDGETLFLSVQHPSADGTEHWPPFGRQSSFDNPATRWPPGDDPAFPPRPSVLAISRKGGGKIGA